MDDYTLRQMFLEQLGQKIKTVRKNRGLSLLELSVDAKISQRHLIRIEQGEVNPSAYHVKLLSDTLGVPPNYLFGTETDD